MFWKVFEMHIFCMIYFSTLFSYMVSSKHLGTGVLVNTSNLVKTFKQPWFWLNQDNRNNYHEIFNKTFLSEFIKITAFLLTKSSFQLYNCLKFLLINTFWKTVQQHRMSCIGLKPKFYYGRLNIKQCKRMWN